MSDRLLPTGSSALEVAAAEALASFGAMSVPLRQLWFTGSNDEYLAQGVGLPTNACITAPPVTEAGRVAIYQEGAWTSVADHRGKTVYSVTDGAAVVINVPGDYPTDTTPLKPATAWDKWNGEKWVTDRAEEKAASNKQQRSQRKAGRTDWRSKQHYSGMANATAARDNHRVR